MQHDRVTPWVTTEQVHLSAIGVQQPQHHANRGGLARAIWPEQPMDLTGGNRQIQPV